MNNWVRERFINGPSKTFPEAYINVWVDETTVFTNADLKVLARIIKPNPINYSFNADYREVAKRMQASFYLSWYAGAAKYVRRYFRLKFPWC